METLSHGIVSQTTFPRSLTAHCRFRPHQSQFERSAASACLWVSAVNAALGACGCSVRSFAAAPSQLGQDGCCRGTQARARLLSSRGRLRKASWEAGSSRAVRVMAVERRGRGVPAGFKARAEAQGLNLRRDFPTLLAKAPE